MIVVVRHPSTHRPSSEQSQLVHRVFWHPSPPVRPSLYFNPSCSKCQTAQAILDEHHVNIDVVRYLDLAPTEEELLALMGKLGIDDPRQMMRTGETAYGELGLDGATRDELLNAIASHPILLERPIFVAGDRAVIARPPERLLELLEKT
jgi:arsenate reductase (glutaredoxin)